MRSEPLGRVIDKELDLDWINGFMPANVEMKIAPGVSKKELGRTIS